MESIVFIIAWIILGIIALRTMIRDVERMIKQYVEDEYKEELSDDQLDKELAETSGKLSNISTIAILIFALMTWPVTVPIVMYGWKRRILDKDL